MAALSPTAMMVSPRTARASAQGWFESPVQTRPKAARVARGGGEQLTSIATSAVIAASLVWRPVIIIEAS